MKKSLIISIMFFVLFFLGCASNAQLSEDTGRMVYNPESEDVEKNDEIEYKIVTKKTARSSNHPRNQREFKSNDFEMPQHLSDKMGGELIDSYYDSSINIVMVSVKCKETINDDIINRLEEKGLIVNTYSDDKCTVRARKDNILKAAELDFIQYMQLFTRLEPSQKDNKSIYSDI
ncbi:MAG: hypothetical protein ACLFSQ_02880 [Candidatus Zixiibacteriota bacterium]